MGVGRRPVGQRGGTCEHCRVSEVWNAPPADGPVEGRIEVPGSKSVTSRALLLAALSGGAATVTGAPATRDTALMVGALRALGVPVDVDGLRVTFGAHDGFRSGTVDCGLAGTVMRFVPPAAALADGPVTFDGDPRARERPMAVVLDALRALGADIDGSTLPFTVRGTGALAGGEVVVDASGSSQFVSGLLLSGARFDKGLVVHHDGKPVPSLPHIDMTVDMLRLAGVVVDEGEPNTWRVAPGPIAARDWPIEPDLSNAAVFLAAAAITGGSVTVVGWPEESTQPGTEILSVLAQAGATDRAGAGRDDRARSRQPPGHRRRPARSERAHPHGGRGGGAGRRPVADPRGRPHPWARDRPHRRAAHRADGARRPVTETPDGLEIHPAPLRADAARPWRAYADHRMATAGRWSDWPCPGSRSTTSTRPRRPSPTSPPSGRRWSGE